MEHELVTYEQAKECGTFIKKGSPHIMVPTYHEKNNSVSVQLYYFKSGCAKPHLVDIAHSQHQRENFIKRERAKLEKEMKRRNVPQEEKQKILDAIASQHQVYIRQMAALGKDTSQYLRGLPKEERNALEKREKENPLQPLSMSEMLKQYGEDLKRIEAYRKQHGEEMRTYFDARETGSAEDYLGKVMAAATVEGMLVTTKGAIQTVTQNLAPTLRQSFEQYDYMKGWSIGEQANAKCKENLREARSVRNQTEDITRALEKTLGFQQGGRGQRQPTAEIDTYDR